MWIEEKDFANYMDIVCPKIIYNAVEFNNLNYKKVDRVRYFLFKDRKYRFGLCVGEKSREYLIPFSAPFASLVPIRKNWTLIQLDDTIKCFDLFAMKNGVKRVCFTLPPYIYDDTLVASIQNCLLREGYMICQQELNFSLLLNLSDEGYIANLPANGRKNLMSALKNELKIKHCETIDEKQVAYSIIVENRKSKGYPLHMSWQQIVETIKIVPHDFFVVSLAENRIAAAIVFYVTEHIAQVIYWGDVSGVSELRPMNYLAFYLRKYYRNKGMQYLDVGPSTKEGSPNYGLCDFKRSIGCKINAKFVMEKVF